RAAAARIEQFIKDIERQIAFSPLPLADLLAASRLEQRVELSKLLRQMPAIAEASLLDRSGHELAYVSRLALDAEGSGRDWTAVVAVAGRRPGSAYFGPVHLRKGAEQSLTRAGVGSA